MTSANLPYGVTVYSGVAYPDLCKRLIDHFESIPKPSNDQRINGKPGSFVYLEIDEENLVSSPAVREAYIRIKKQVSKYLDEYVADADLREKIKKGIFSLQPRMKRYDCGGGFPLHSDDSTIAALLRRFAYILYLNDNFEGGDTIFRSGTGELARITPSQGALTIFPIHPVLMHEGAVVTQGSKYIFNGFVSTITSQARVASAGEEVSRFQIISAEIVHYTSSLLRAAEKVFGNQ